MVMVDVKLRKLGCQNREGYVMKYHEDVHDDRGKSQYQNAVPMSGLVTFIAAYRYTRISKAYVYP